MRKLLNFFMVIGTVAIVISGISSGAFTSGMQARANFATETKEDRDQRSKVGLYTAVIGLVAFSIAGMIRYFG